MVYDKHSFVAWIFPTTAEAWRIYWRILIVGSYLFIHWNKIQSPIKETFVVTGNHYLLCVSFCLFRMFSKSSLNFGITFFAYSKTSAYTISHSHSSQFNKSLDNSCSNSFKDIVACLPLLLDCTRDIHSILQIGLLFKLTIKTIVYSNLDHVSVRLSQITSWQVTQNVWPYKYAYWRDWMGK